jgi:hypothetical protein
VQDADAFAAVESEVVQREHQLTAVAVAGPAHDQLGQDAGQPQLLGWIGGAAGGHEEVHRRRANVFHALG